MPICTKCGDEVEEYAYGGTRGKKCKPCFLAQNAVYGKKSFYGRKIDCPRCGERKIDPTRSKVCNRCAGAVYIRAKERGKPTFHKPSGYWLVKLPPDDPMISMANGNNHVRQHRLVMADHIGRPLLQDETVHHINHDRGDNRIENLELMARADHNAMHLEDRLRARREKYPKIEVDEAEMRRLAAVPGMRAQEMADILGVSWQIIHTRMKEYGLTPFKRGRATKVELARRTSADPPVPERLR